MREVNLTQGPIMGRLVRFSLPMIAGNMLRQVYNLVDSLAYMPAQEFGNAYSLFVSQNLCPVRRLLRPGVLRHYPAGTQNGPNAIWLAIPIGWVLADGAGLWFYARRRHKEG